MVRTDNGTYVVKWQQNPQHRRILINEMMGTEILRRLGVAVPEWALIHVDSGFLSENPQINVQLRQTEVPVEPGWHFGSRVPKQKTLPDLPVAQMLNRLNNLGDFLGAFVFDLWSDNRDGRQAIFFRQGNRHYTSQMIDHGFAFGFEGTEWRMRDIFIRKKHPILLPIYEAQWANPVIDDFIARIQRLAEYELADIRRLVPTEWLESDGNLLDHVCGALYTRSRRLDTLIAEARWHF